SRMPPRAADRTRLRKLRFAVSYCLLFGVEAVEAMRRCRIAFHCFCYSLPSPHRCRDKCNVGAKTGMSRKYLVRLETRPLLARSARTEWLVRALNMNSSVSLACGGNDDNGRVIGTYALGTAVGRHAVLPTHQEQQRMPRLWIHLPELHQHRVNHQSGFTFAPQHES